MTLDPIGESRLREIFLKTDNHVQGKYLAEVTKGENVYLMCLIVGVFLTVKTKLRRGVR